MRDNDARRDIRNLCYEVKETKRRLGEAKFYGINYIGYRYEKGLTGVVKEISDKFDALLDHLKLDIVYEKPLPGYVVKKHPVNKSEQSRGSLKKK